MQQKLYFLHSDPRFGSEGFWILGFVQERTTLKRPLTNGAEPWSGYEMGSWDRTVLTKWNCDQSLQIHMYNYIHTFFFHFYMLFLIYLYLILYTYINLYLYKYIYIYIYFDIYIYTYICCAWLYGTRFCYCLDESLCPKFLDNGQQHMHLLHLLWAFWPHLSLRHFS